MCLGTGMASAWRGANKEVMKPMHGENSEDVDGVTNATRSSALLRWDGDWSHSDFCRTLGIIPELFSSLLHFFLHMQMAYIHLSSLQLTLYNCYSGGLYYVIFCVCSQPRGHATVARTWIGHVKMTCGD